MRILVAQINPTIGNLDGNAKKIISAIEQGRKEGVAIVLFPELALTGYPPEDFLLMPHFLTAVEEKQEEIVAATQDIVAIVGMPRRSIISGREALLNSAAIIKNRMVVGYQDKYLLPTYDVFNERRYFAPSTRPVRLWSLCGKSVGILICEDMWGHTPESVPTPYSENPVADLISLRPDLVLNLSASPFSTVKAEKRYTICRNTAQTLDCPVVLCNQVGGNDSLIFDGYSLFIGRKGEVLGRALGFEEDRWIIETEEERSATLSFCEEEEIYRALVLGIRDYFRKTGFQEACLGISGGIDSAVVAALAVEALGREKVHGIMMPSRYTSQESRDDARDVAENLRIPIEEISIEPLFRASLDLLTPHFGSKGPDVTEENLQSRLRGVLLMSLSNKHGYLVLNTGNKSELGMGYATLYGDMVGGLGVLSDVTKNQVYALARYINRDRWIIPSSILAKAPSAELRPGQKDSDSLPDYDVLDHILNDYVVGHCSPDEMATRHGYPLALVKDLIARIHRNEYKRRQAAPGLRISEKAFSVGRRFPIVQGWV